MTANFVTTVPSRFPVIQPALLGTMKVLETVDTEAIITARLAKLKVIWAQNDPPAAAQYDVGNLEFDPLRIQAELSTYFELLLRDRVNQAARAVTLAYASGTDLDAIASRYPYGMTRLPGETDAAFRNRIWLSPSILSLSGPGQGTYESYVFWAKSADVTIKDASAFTTPGTGVVNIALLNSSTINTTWLIPPSTPNTWVNTPGATPAPTATQIQNIVAYISDPGTARKGLTDVLNVMATKVASTKLVISVWLFPGVDKVTLMGEITAAISQMIIDINWLGADLTMLAINGRLAQAGVYRSQITSPPSDLLVGSDTTINITSCAITYMGTGE